MSTSTECVLICGDSLDVLATFEENSIDSIVCDPPYGLSFMGKHWDYDIPTVEIWKACLRVLKPGGHLLAFAGTRTQHRMACRIEDAGFEIRDMIAWVYAQGFPKSHNVGNAVDKSLGCENRGHAISSGSQIHPTTGKPRANGELLPKYEGRTDEGKKWAGFGTALKPAMEPITVARKPLIGTVAANVLANGTGGLNIDGCRVGTDAITTTNGKGFDGSFGGGTNDNGGTVHQGRWPANLIHDGSEEVVGLFPDNNPGCKPHVVNASPELAEINKAKGWGSVSVPKNKMAGFSDGGTSAARFFYCPKASKSERNAGCEGLEQRTTSRMNTHNGSEDDGDAWHPIDDRTGETRDRFTTKTRNHHPTVKPIALMRYLCRLVTQPGGTVLDPFMGSGSTGVAAKAEGFDFIGIEKEPEFFAIAEKRCAAAGNERVV